MSIHSSTCHAIEFARRQLQATDANGRFWPRPRASRVRTSRRLRERRNLADAVMQNVFQHIAADWEDFGATPKTLLDAGDGCVVALGRYHGKFRPTGKTLDAEFAHIFYLEGKQLVKFHQYADSALWNEVMS
jgi:ketosteroid isomerase-like protein